MNDLSRYVEDYIGALREGSQRGAEQVVEQALAEGVTPEQIYVGIFQPALVRVGRLWERNQFSVAQEHLSTSITQRLMGRFADYFRDPGRSNGRKAIFSCVSGEQHVLGLQMTADIFRRDGWEVFFLGANVPTEDLIALAERFSVDLIGLSATLTLHVPIIQDLIRQLRRRGLATRVAVGGGPFCAIPELWQQLGADLCGVDALDALAQANSLWASPDQAVHEPEVA